MARGRYRIKITPDVVERARQIDLLTYLQTCEPDNVVRISPHVYKTREHDSLKISNGKWFWWSRGFGGVSALDYLIKVREIRFLDAVQMLTGSDVVYIPVAAPVPEKKEKQLRLPTRNKNCNQVIHYLTQRGIDKNIIQDCIQRGFLYESANYHNAVFVGKDGEGIPRYAACRGTMPGSNFKRDVSGSDKHFSFRLEAMNPSSASSVHLFEAAIDLLSYATYLQCEGKDYKRENLLSLSGVYQGSNKIPAALKNYLDQNPTVKIIYLHLDNDEAGRASAAALGKLLGNQYQVIDEPPQFGKDVNDCLRDYLKEESNVRNRKQS